MPGFYTNRFGLDGAAPSEILVAADWTQVTVIGSASGITITYKNDSTGVPLPADVPITFYMDPGAKLWANGPAGATIGAIVQPLPLSLRLMRMASWVLEKLLPPGAAGAGCR